MKWTKLTIETTTEATDMLSYQLAEYGVEGIEIEDKIPLSEEDRRAMYIDILPELPPDDGVMTGIILRICVIISVKRCGICQPIWVSEPAASGSVRRRIRTGSTIGRNSFIPSGWRIT